MMVHKEELEGELEASRQPVKAAPAASIVGRLQTYARLKEEEAAAKRFTIRPGEVGAPLFLGLWPLLAHAAREGLSEEALHEWIGLPPELRLRPNAERFLKVWRREVRAVSGGGGRLCCRRQREPSLLRAMFGTWRREILILAVPRVLDALLATLAPVVLGEMLRAAEEGRMPELVPWAVLLFVVRILKVSIAMWQALRSYLLGGAIRGGLASCLILKATRLEPAVRQQLGTGFLVNVLSGDIVRMGSATEELHELWQTPLTLLLALVVLFWKMGPLAVAAMIVMAMFGPFNAWVVKKTRKARVGSNRARDARVKTLADALHGMKVVKMMAWEEPLCRVLRQLRAEELRFVRLLKKIIVVNNCIDWTAPVLLPMLLFAGAIFTGRQITASSAFSALAILDIVQGPMNRLPRMLTSLVDLLVGVDRVKSIYLAEELEVEALDAGEGQETSSSTVMAPPLSTPPPAAGKRKGEGAAERRPLEEDAFPARSRGRGRYRRGGPAAEQPAVHLAAGTGVAWLGASPRSSEASPTSLGDACWQLRARGELRAPAGALVHVRGGVGAGKSTLLQALLGEVHVEVGDIALRGRQVTYCQQEPWIRAATVRENILFGLEFVQERFDAVVEACGLGPDLERLPLGDLTCIGERGVTLSGGQRARLALARACYPEPDVVLLDDVISAVDARVARHIVQRCLCGPDALLRCSTRIIAVPAGGLQGLLPNADVVWDLQDRAVLQLLQEPSEASSPEVEEAQDTTEASGAKSPPAAVEVVEVAKGMEREERERGAVRLDIWLSYFRVLGWWFLLLALPLYAGSQGTVMASNFLLAEWTDATGSGVDEGTSVIFLAKYSALLLASGCIVVCRNVCFAYFASLRASRKIHDSALPALFAAPMEFFWANPAGRMMNRLSEDLSAIDHDIMPPLQGLFKWTYDLILGVGAVLFVTPPLTLLLLPAFWLYRRTNQRHRACKRELERLLCVVRGAFTAHFDEMLHGAAHIRAWGAEERLRSLGEELRVPQLKLGWLMTLADQWKSIRLSLIANGLMLSASICARFAASGSSSLLLPTISAGMLGVMLKYTLQVSGDFSTWIDLLTSVELCLVRVERVTAYCSLSPECQEGEAWQPIGAPSLRFAAVELSYGKPGAEVHALRGTTFYLAPGLSLGICGRTGAGKSSVVAALFRLVELRAGQITLDGCDISMLRLRDLRRFIGAIPQEPLLFAGDLRFNLDPLGESKEDEAWETLNVLGLQALMQDRGGMQMELEPGGGNLSAGERQLLATARALLQRPKLLVLDEATANVDEPTEQRIMAALQSEKAGGSTVLSIAHRVRTLLPLDQVLVLAEGQVQEFGAPLQLMREPGSAFRELVEAAMAEAPAA